LTGEPRIAWRLATAVIAVVIGADGIVALYGVWTATHDGPRTAVAFVLLAAVLSIQLCHFSRQGARLGTPLSYGLLGLQAGLAYLPLLLFGQPWVAVPSFLAASLLLALPKRAGVAGYAVVVASSWFIQSTLTDSLLDRLYIVDSVAGFGLTVFLLTRLAGVVGELTRARGELARLAVADEQLRFARDLHDLLGISLSAITLKGELARRLVRPDRARARSELGEILTVARQSLADVRAVATGQRELSLDQECRTAESVLGAAEVTVAVHVDPGELPAAVGTALGTALREGTTNILRHSNATHCRIDIRRTEGAVTLDLVNDGVGLPRPTDAHGGSGLANLVDRVAALRGTVTAAPVSAGSYRLRVRIPLTRNASPEREPAGGSIGGWPIRVLVSVELASMGVAAGLSLLSRTTDGPRIAVGLGCLAAVTVLQLAYFTRPSTRLRAPLSYALLAVEAALIYLPLPLGPAWVSLPGLLAGSALLVLPPIAGWSVLVASVGVYTWHFAADGQLPDLPSGSTSVVLTAMVAFGLISLTRLVRELADTRRRLARTAIAEQRLRFAQDLHELLGRRLTALIDDAELTIARLESEPDRAEAGITDILRLSRQALTAVRAVASGYRGLSLDAETRSARSLLTAADVELRMTIEHGELPAPVRTFLAAALREGVTNLLKHSRAEHCRIEIIGDATGVRIDIVNDGGLDDGGSGHGLRNLGEQVRELGGRLDAGPVEGGRFRLRAEVPFT
jgi:signal transduction histidine kinase